MLVLSRRAGEKIVIGNDIVIEILSASGGEGGVRVGISAPEATRIYRFEVYEEIQAANNAADAVLDQIGKGVLENLSAAHVHIKHIDREL